MTKTLYPFKIGDKVICYTRKKRMLLGEVEKSTETECLLYFEADSTYIDLGRFSDVSVEGNVITFH